MREFGLAFDFLFTYMENLMVFVGHKIILKEQLDRIIARDKLDLEYIADILTHLEKDLDEKYRETLVSALMDFITPEGETVVSTVEGVLKSPKKVTAREREYIDYCKNNPWKLHVSKPAFGITAPDENIIPISIGLTNNQGKFIGYVTSGINVEKLSSKLKSFTQSENYEYLVLRDFDFEYLLSSNNLRSLNNMDELKKKLLDVSSNNKNFGILKNTIKIKEVEYIFYSKSVQYPFLILVGIKKKDVSTTKELENQILDLNKEGKYNEMFLLSLLYLFQHKIIDPVLSKNVELDDSVGFKIPKVFSANVNELILELEQLKNFTDIKIQHEVAEQTSEQRKYLLEQRETFFKSLVHDLRNPLGQVECALGLLQAEGKAGEEGEMMQVGIDNIRNLVDGVLLIAKLESGNLELNKTNIDLSSFVDDIIKANKFTYALEGIDLIKEMMGSKYISVSADEQILERCIANLLSNARKFTKKGCVKIIISKDEKSKEVTINVKDTGEGIKKEDIPRILEEFGQTEEGKKQKSSTGIGLPTVKKFIELHGGRLEIESEVGKGSEFKLVLPV